MRTVFKNSELAHVWAQQNQTEGRADNWYFRDATIYSYGQHFPIACFASPSVVLFTTRGYSNTTARHIHCARSALYGLPVTVHYVTDPLANSYTSHADNVVSMRTEFDALLIKASRAKANRPYITEQAVTLRTAMIEYCAEFALEEKAIPCAVSDELLAAAKTAASKVSKAKAKQTNARNAKRAAQYLLDAAEWRAGTINGISYFDYDTPTMLRLSQDGAQIETSRGARVPVDVAPMLWKLVKHARANGRYVAERTLSIGHYTLREVCADGSLIVGCHTLPYVELESIARQLNYIA